MNTKHALHSLSARIEFRLTLGLVLAVLAGLRLAGRDNDYLAYQTIYSQILSGQHGRYEWLFAQLVEFSGHVLNLPFPSFLVLCAIIATLPKFLAFHRYAANFWLAVAGYVTIYWVLHEMTQIRSGLALAFAALAFGLAYERRWLLAGLGFSTAVLFHSSLLAMAPFLLLPRVWQGETFRLPLLILIAVALAMFGIRYFGTVAAVAEQYLHSRAVGYGERLFSVRLLVCSGIVGIGLWRLKELSPTLRPYVWMSLWASILYVTFFWEAAYANRFFEMAGFFMLFWIGALRGWPGRITVGAFLCFGALTMANYYRHSYLVPF